MVKTTVVSINKTMVDYRTIARKQRCQRKQSRDASASVSVTAGRTQARLHTNYHHRHANNTVITCASLGLTRPQVGTPPAGDTAPLRCRSCKSQMRPKWCLLSQKYPMQRAVLKRPNAEKLVHKAHNDTAVFST